MHLMFYVEGQTEETFAKKVLFPHLERKGLFCLGPILVAHQIRKSKVSRGGILSYAPVRKEILNFLSRKGDDFRLTTLVDLYGLPSDFPQPQGLSSNLTGKDKAVAFARSWKQDIGDPRFMPFLFSYEFESLVLANPDSLFAVYPEESEAIRSLSKGIARFSNPEDINDSSETAPSKRILKHLPDYRKAVDGPQAVMETGLDNIRRRCPHFNEWLETIESL